MDFALSAPHTEIRRTVRDFAEREILPVADEMERRGEFPTEIIRKAAGLGLLGVPYPEEVGGTGLDTLAYAITIEELSRVSGSVGIIVSAHTSLGCAPLFTAGNPEQQERFLRPLASGAKLGAYGLTEAGAGSDSRGTRTRAHRDGDEWVLSGSKRFITNAGVAETYIVTAVTDRNADSGKISAFIVEAGTPGFSIGRMEEKMGLHASNTGELLFDECRIPVSNLLGEEGEGDRLFLKTLDGGRIGIGAMALGIAQAAYEAASAYAKERQQFGRPIASFQGIAFKIADMATQIEAARLLVYRAAWLKDRGEPYSTEAAMAKLFASEVARQVTNDALQVHGGYGYVTEYKVERYLRDAKLTEIGEGTSEIQRMVIARNLLGVRAM
ncbi:MAG TPA: acyl-CoA dehydrogenase family protein [Candidatus Limnocylindria bacterium]|jgi:alkylation response protein AidB-like acyl-CoA dehydrogenase|nr:acyl-CoA dehydrogenase family protein [Candidatus Limnocylindria bacterium]